MATGQELTGAADYVAAAERAVASPGEIGSAAPRDLQHIGIVGGGLMGAGIAAASLSGGFEVTLLERDAKAAGDARRRVVGLIDGTLKRGKIDEAERDRWVACLKIGHDVGAAADADLVIEAVFEDLAVKQEIFRSLAAAIDRQAILATNTSYLDPVTIADRVDNAARILGLHFFSPAHVMKLLEVVRTPTTSPEVLATAFAFAGRLGKVAVLSGICDGFIGNRMLAAYRRQADYMLADGCLPHEIDKAMRDFGMPMGPYELQDLTGLQISWANRKRQAPTRDPGQRYVTIADQLCELGRLGQKAGRGWYRYEEGDRTPKRDREVERLIEDYSASNGIARCRFSDDEICERLVAVLINEGGHILDEGIAGQPEAVDMVKIHGYGFPKRLGGPMYYADVVGHDRIRAAMQAVAAESPGSWTIACYLGGTRFRKLGLAAAIKP